MIGSFSIVNSDVMDALKAIPDCSYHGCLTDPPYHLTGRTGGAAGFMGKAWDGGDIAFRPELWREVLRVLKPGAMLLAFGGTRTHHRLACAIEDAGFELRDCFMYLWVFGSGFPKSLDISRAIDRTGGQSDKTSEFKEMLTAAVAASGKSRGAIDAECGFTMRYDTPYAKDPVGWGCTVPSLKQWETIKRVLPIKGDWESFVLGAEREVIRTELRTNAPNGVVSAGRAGLEVERHITTPSTAAAKQWSGYGSAAKPAYEPIIMAMKPLDGTFASNALKHGVAGLNIDGARIPGQPEATRFDPSRHSHDGWRMNATGRETAENADGKGRWPSNLILDDGAAELLDQQSGATESRIGKPRSSSKSGDGYGMTHTGSEYADQGGASRFFYVAKSDSAERHSSGKNTHPTVKPIDLTAYLSKLILPPVGKRQMLVPFSGSGSEIIGALRAGWNEVLGIERDPEYVELSKLRICDDAPLFNADVGACDIQDLK